MKNYWECKLKKLVVAIVIFPAMLTGCVGLDQKNEGFGENAAEIGRRTLTGVMTLGISELVLADVRKRERLNAVRETNYRRWYDGLPDTEKTIEDMTEAPRYQLPRTIIRNRQQPTSTVPPPPAYYVPSPVYGGGSHRRTTNCTSNLIGNQVYTDCY